MVIHTHTAYFKLTKIAITNGNLQIILYSYFEFHNKFPFWYMYSFFFLKFPENDSTLT